MVMLVQGIADVQLEALAEAPKAEPPRPTARAKATPNGTAKSTAPEKQGETLHVV